MFLRIGCQLNVYIAKITTESVSQNLTCACGNDSSLGIIFA